MATKRVIKKLGVLHITCSTYKVKPDNWKRFSKVFPEVANKLRHFYFNKGEKNGSSIYLPKRMRYDLLNKAKGLIEQNKMVFGSCREGLGLNSRICDGSWLIQ